MTQPPTIAQLHNLADRAATGLTPDEQQRLREGIDALYAELAALKSITSGYCEHCGRGDCSPTTDQWYDQRQRADQAEDQLRRTRIELEHWQTVTAKELREQRDEARARIRQLTSEVQQQAALVETAAARATALEQTLREVLGSFDRWRTVLGPKAQPDAAHVYLSTRCWHGDHAYCQAPCQCSCHQTKEN